MILKKNRKGGWLMIKFIAQNAKDSVLFIGFDLSEKNIELIKNKQPIIIKCK